MLRFSCVEVDACPHVAEAASRFTFCPIIPHSKVLSSQGSYLLGGWTCASVMPGPHTALIRGKPVVLVVLEGVSNGLIPTSGSGGSKVGFFREQRGSLGIRDF